MHCHRGIVCICWSMNMMLQWTQRQLSVWLNYPLAFLARVCWEILPTIDAQISHLSNYGFHFWDGGERSIDYNFSFLKRLKVKFFQLFKKDRWIEESINTGICSNFWLFISWHIYSDICVLTSIEGIVVSLAAAADDCPTIWQPLFPPDGIPSYNLHTLLPTLLAMHLQWAEGTITDPSRYLVKTWTHSAWAVSPIMS